MNWLIENFNLIVTIVVLIAIVVFAVYYFVKMPTNKQKEKITEWLVWACIEAEKRLQSETGQLKLREVWNMFCAIPAFSWVAKIISYEVFKTWVNEALIIAKKLLTNNKALATYVYGDNAEKEIAKLKEQIKE